MVTNAGEDVGRNDFWLLLATLGYCWRECKPMQDYDICLEVSQKSKVPCDPTSPLLGT